MLTALHPVLAPAPISAAAEERAQQVRHRQLAAFNAQRLRPALPGNAWKGDIDQEARYRLMEGEFVEAERRAIASAASQAPHDPDRFMAWFCALEQQGPGQHDVLFTWLADQADLSAMRWFLSQEAVGEAGFDDLVALTQVRMPVQAKLELGRNYWDELGRGQEAGMHGPLLRRVVHDLDLTAGPEDTVWEALAVGNLLIALASNRRYAYHALGALGAVELTAPSRVALVNDGMRRLGIPASTRRYYELHAALDVKHAAGWNQHVLRPLCHDVRIVQAIAEGALMRLAAGARCYRRYRAHLQVDDQGARANLAMAAAANGTSA
jgi:hypothetical protein